MPLPRAWHVPRPARLQVFHEKHDRVCAKIPSRFALYPLVANRDLPARDRWADRAANGGLVPLSDAASAIDSTRRYHRAPPSGPGRTRNRAATRILVRGTFEIPTAVLRWREPRNSQTPFPASVALTFLQLDTLLRQDADSEDQRRQLNHQSLRALNPPASLAQGAGSLARLPVR